MFYKYIYIYISGYFGQTFSCSAFVHESLHKTPGQKEQWTKNPT